MNRDVIVPEGQTPLNERLGHRYLDVINEGAAARDAGTGSPYHGHSLEHCLHATGWVQRDLRLALDAALAKLAPEPVEAGLRPFDPARYIESLEDAGYYLEAASEGNDPEHLRRAVQDVIRAALTKDTSHG